MGRKTFIGILTAIVVMAAVAVWQPTDLRSQQPTSLGADGVVSVLIRLGANDAAPRSWDGSLSVAGGDLLGLRDWRPRPGNEVSGSSWKLASYQGPNFRWRPWEITPPVGSREYVVSTGVVVDVKGSASTWLRAKTRNGDFEFRFGDAAIGRPSPLLGGAVVIERVAPAELLTAKDYENDYATVLGGSGGEVWAAWIGYRNNATEILARRFDGQRWTDVQKISERPGDYYLVKMGRDGKGRAWAVWSAKVDGNWDLYGRYLENGSWSASERLTNDPQPDAFHNLATDAKGNLWLVWQGVREGDSDIFARRHDGSSWSGAEKVSSAAANDWEPVVVGDSKGAVYVGWDSYGAGNYDVLIRKWSGGAWGEEMKAAATPKYEAHVSLAVDKQDRLWVAWNESGVEWGKDTGWVLNREGTRLYQWRTIGLAIHDGSGWKAPASDINTALPEALQTYNDFPVLYPDAAGRVWLYFRHRTLRIADVPSDAPAHRASWEIWGTTLEGDRWSAPLHIPFARFRQDARWGLASDGKGNVWAAWPTDNRDYEEFLFEHADVYAAKLPALDSAASAPKLVVRRDEEIPAFPIHLEEEKELAAIRGYAIQSEGKTYRIYRGDTHRHSEISMDGNNDESLLQTYRYAIDAAQLDYLLASEHNGNGGPDVEYINWLLQQTADVFSVSNKFQPFFGYERSLTYPDGHRNILFAKRGNPTLPITPAQAQHKEGAASLYQYLKKYNGIAISHTSATTMGTDWRDNDPAVEPLVEIYQGDRVSAEYEGAPRAAYSGNERSAPGNLRPAGYVWNAWAKGYKLGVQAASDHLSTHISYACTIAEEFTREGMLDAMKKRHSYGATDNIILDYRLQAGGKDYLQGDIVTVEGDFRLSLRVIGTKPIRQIDIIRDQSFVHNRQNLGEDVSFTYVDNEAGSGEHYYYVRVIQVDGNIAWSSPIWVTRAG
jgi:hypothetical protein